MILEDIEKLSAFDPEVGAAIRAEYDRQRGGLELIASENVVSDAVLLAAGSILTNKYAEGYPDHRYYGGCACVDLVEKTAIARAKELFGCGACQCAAAQRRAGEHGGLFRRCSSPATRSWA